MTMDSEMNIYTVNDYLINKVKFEMPMKALLGIMHDRELENGIDLEACDKDKVRLAYADMLKWFVLGPSKVNNTSDSDNGWTHSGGGYDMSDNDRSEMKAEANAIYAELEPDSMIKKKSTFRVTSNGVNRANYSTWGEPLPHIIKIVRKIVGKADPDDPFADDDAPVGEDKEIILYYGEGRSYTDTTTEGDKNVDQNKRKASIPVRYDEWDADRCPLDGDTIYSTVGNNTEVGMVKDCEPDNNRTVVYWNLTRV